jgi:hypothetical protein
MADLTANKTLPGILSEPCHGVDVDFAAEADRTQSSSHQHAGAIR